jgi:N-sulfoglucosamine sulfohydrolase
LECVRGEATLSAMNSPRRAGFDRRQFLAAAPLATLAACASTAETPREEPRATPRGAPKARNLLVLLADDLSGIDLGCYGSPNVRTPNLDALAARGTQFDWAYTAVGVCQPSRSSLYTGLYPTGHGALGFGPISAGVATWPQLLNKVGVASALIGKLDVDPPEQFPFEHLVKARDMASRRASEVWRREFETFLQRAGERRFAAVLALVDPHRPFEEAAPEKPITDPERVVVPPFLWDTPGARLELARYYDCIARLDRTVGQVLEALRAAGREDDTLVVFTSDNGAAFPFAKATLYEPGVRMPLLVAGPGVRAGVRSDAFVSQLDLLPTALELFDADAHAGDGAALQPLLRGESASGRDEFVSMQTENNRESSTPARALHTRRFKYIRNFAPETAVVSNIVNHTLAWESGAEAAASDERIKTRMQAYLYRPAEELYDLERDPHELENLASAREHAARVESMRARLREWMERRADPALADWT